MSVPLEAVGRELEPHHTYVDARWTMSYAAVRRPTPTRCCLSDCTAERLSLAVTRHPHALSA